MQRRYRHLDTLILAFVVVLMISNLVAGKLVAIGPAISISGAHLLFPLTYIFGDIFTEVYGYAASRRAIWTGFMGAALLGLMGNIIVALPPAPDWPHQAAYETVFHQVPRILVASLIAFWLGEFANAFVLAKLKVLTQGRMLWSRTVGSTVVGQLVDTVVVVVIVFAGVVPVGEMFKLMYSGYFGKVLYEALATPLTYAVVNWLKRVEGVDVFDNGTDFNPFHAVE